MLEHFAEFERPVTVLRKSAGTYIGVEWVPAPNPVKEETTMCVLPVTAITMKMMPEGSYTAGDKRFYHTGPRRYDFKDVFISENNTYEVRDIQDRNFEGGFTVYFAKRIVTQTEDANA